MASDPRIAYITTRAQQLGIDPKAALAVASREGLGGGIGDGGHAFGPFQLNNAGGVLTGKFKGLSPGQINQWAWSKPGIDYALSGIANVARGLKGSQAINAIVSRFERPAAPGAEIAGALKAYGLPSSAGAPQTGGAASLAQGMMGGGNPLAPTSDTSNLLPLIQMIMARNQQAQQPIAGFKPF